MAFIALRQHEVANGRIVTVGDLVPEADDWVNAGAWVQAGFVAQVPDGKEREFLQLLRDGMDASHLSPASKPYHLHAAAAALRDSNAPTGNIMALADTGPAPQPQDTDTQDGDKPIIKTRTTPKRR